MPSVKLDQVNDLTLRNIENRIQFISKAKREEKRFFLNDVGSLIFYGVSHGNAYYNAEIKSKIEIEKQYHEIKSKMLGIEIEKEEIKDVDKELNDLFA